MNYSFLARQSSPPSMHPRGSIYAPPMDNGGLSQSVYRHMEGQESSYSGLNEENSKSFFMHISQCMWVLAQMLHVHVDIALKVTYTHKQVFFWEFIGTSKYNMRKLGPRSLQRDMEGHKGVIYQV